MKLSKAHIEILAHLAQGSSLKSHRDLDGTKVYRLHPLDGAIQLPSPKIVDDLKRRKYIDSNKKFPAATYLLTDKGRQIVARELGEDVRVLSTRNYSG